MRRLLELSRAILISPELLAALVPVAVASLAPRFVKWLSAEITPDDFPGKVVLLGLPIGLLGVTFTLAYGLLNPDESRQALKSWPGYWRLKLRIWVALGWATIGVVCTLAGWFLYRSGRILLGPTLLLCGLLVPAATVITLGVAKIQLRDVLDGS